MSLLEYFPEFTFQPSKIFMWSPDSRIISYDPRRLATDQGKLMLLHELGHALLSHRIPTDENRYQVERDAWELARLLAQKLSIRPNEALIARKLQEVRRLGY